MEPNDIPVAKPAPQKPLMSQYLNEQPRGPTSGRATAVFVLGILSILCAGFLTGIPAIILGSMELKAIKKGESPASGEGITKAGWTLGIVGTVLTCLATIALIGMIVLGISLGSMEAIKNTV